MNFNPKVREFLKEKPDLTIIGLYWAGFWRLYLAVLAGAFAIGLISAVFE